MYSFLGLGGQRSSDVRDQQCSFLHRLLLLPEKKAGGGGCRGGGMERCGGGGHESDIGGIGVGFQKAEKTNEKKISLDVNFCLYDSDNRPPNVILYYFSNRKFWLNDAILLRVMISRGEEKKFFFHCIENTKQTMK